MQAFKDDLVKMIYGKAREGEDESLAHELSSKLKIPFIDLNTYAIEFTALGSIEESVSRESEVAGFHRAGRRLFVACTDPQNPRTKAVLEKMKAEGLILSVFITTHKGMRRAWSRYADLENGQAVESGVVSVNDALINSFVETIKSVEDFKRESTKILSEGKQSTTKIFEVILAGAYALGVSDIHVEPEENDIRVRMRLDRGNIFGK